MVGLDIYLYHCADLAAATAIEEECEAEKEKVYADKSYSQLTEAEKDERMALCDAIGAKYGIVDYRHNSITSPKEDIGSSQFPDHMFKLNYLRSSYNEGGINSVLDSHGIGDLYYIFQPDDRYQFVPDWAGCLDRCNESISQFRGFLESPMGKYSVTRCGLFPEADDAASALKMFEHELKTHNPNSPFGGDYSNKAGVWYLDEGIRVHGVVGGRSKGFMGTGETYLIVSNGKDEPTEDNWYYQALLVTKEMIEYVLGQPHPENYFLSWKRLT